MVCICYAMYWEIHLKVFFFFFYFNRIDYSITLDICCLLLMYDVSFVFYRWKYRKQPKKCLFTTILHKKTCLQI